MLQALCVAMCTLGTQHLRLQEPVLIYWALLCVCH